MKARIIKTGEEITIIGISKEWGTTQYYGSDGIYHQRTFKDEELEFIDDPEAQPIDWEQRRYEIAKDVLANIPANCPESLETKVSIAVMRADALIKELKKQANEEDNV